MVPQCDIFAAVVNSSFLRFVLISTLIWSAAAVPINLLMIAVTCRHNLIHYNIKWILVTHLICLVVHDISRIANHSWELLVFSRGYVDCSYLLSAIPCVIVRVPSHITMYLSFSTTFMMSIERCVATYNLGSYDRNRSVGPCLVSVQVLMATAFISAIYIQFELPQSMAYCLIASMTTVMVLYSQILIFLIFQLIAIIIFHYLIKFNRKMKTELLTRDEIRLFSKGQLITKLYQVRENLRTMKTLFLFFFVSCFVSFASNTLRGAVHLYKAEFSETTYYGLIELSISLPPYSVVVPIILWYSYRRVRQKIVQKHRNIRECNTTMNSNQSHFTVLRESWK